MKRTLIAACALAMMAAAAGEALILLAVFLSLPFARRRLSYEVWHTTHLGPTWDLPFP